MAGYEELGEMVSEALDERNADLRECEQCGSTTTREICRKCALLDAIEAV